MKKTKKKTKLKRAAALILAGLLAASMLAGCQEEGASSAAPGSDASSPAESGGTAAQEYNGNDISQPVELIHYIVGDMPEDYESVWDEINKKLKEDLNATVSLKNIGMSDYQTKYSLTIGSGEKIDLIYTGSWAYYTQEASKGAFAEISDEVLEKYMPLTKENQAPESFEQAKINGKAYFVPCNLAKASSNTILIRGDLREKYGLDPLETVDDLKEYYQKVVENEQGTNIFPFAASQKNDLKAVLFSQINNYVALGSANLGDYFYYVYQEDPVEEDDIIYAFEDPAYLEFAKEMKEWADLGFWSKSAIANNTDPKDSFLAGASASYTQNLGSCGVVANDVLENHPEWKPEIYDLTPDCPKIKGSYMGDGTAIMETSENQERAFMYLDLLKFDETYYNLVRLGIEDVHWTDEGDYEGTEYYGYYATTDESEKYPFGNAISWGIKNGDFERTNRGKFEDEIEIGNRWAEVGVESPTAGFSFDETPVSGEMSNLNNTKVKYMNTLDLGLAADVESTLEEFKSQLEISGIEKVKQELVNQLNAYNEGR